MKVLVSWLREFVDVPGTPEEIAAKMSVRGFAVEGIEPIDDASGTGSTPDAVLDFDVTANRPDCMSVIGIAREVATAYALPLRQPAIGAGRDAAALSLAALRSVADDEVRIDVDNPDLCSRYVGAVADVTVAASPAWLQQRLRAAGVRPISNIVDITNYVLLELGQPMHAFDASRIGGNAIRVRTARAGESLTTLDGQARPLTPEMLVIADAQHPIALAGVMGGAASEVTDGTTTIVFESAYFNPLSVRRTSRRLGLKTEASMRFERGSDPALPAVAMQRACALLAVIGAGTARGTLIDCYPQPHAPATLMLRRAKLAGLLGFTIPDADVQHILASLGFGVTDTVEGWAVAVPTRRVDVVREVDLIEEVARHYGFDRVPTTFPALHVAPAPADPRIARARQIRSAMTGAGFYETVTFGFIAAGAAAPFAAADDIVAIANPLAETFGVLRPSLVPGLVTAVGHNRRHEQKDVRLFETGARFGRAAGERLALAAAWLGAAVSPHWSGGTRDVDFFDVKGLVERLGRVLQTPFDVRAQHTSWLVPGRSAAVIADETEVGRFGQLVPALAEPWGVPVNEPLYVLEIDLEAVAAAAGGRGETPVQALPRHPSVTRDISIVVDETLPAGEIRRTIQQAAPPTLVRVREFDRYQGKGIPEQKVSLSLRLTFRSPDRTLTDAEVQAAMDLVLGALRSAHGAVQR